MNRGFISAFRLWLLCAVVFTCFGGIGVRLVNLQVHQAEHLSAEVERTRKRVQVVHARRGEIRDRNGSLLATNRSFIEVGVDPHGIRPEDTAAIPELARLLGVPVREIEEAFARKTMIAEDGHVVRQIRWAKLADSVDEATFDAVQQLGIRAVYGNRQFRRVYPMGSLAAHVVGFVNREGTAAMGAESHLDYYLRGQDGWVESERDGRRMEMAQFRSREVAATDGMHVELSLDSVVQDIIEREMRDIVAKYNPVGATIIVSEPSTGFLLGLANYPTFDLNTFNKADLASQRNRAVTDIFEPGSTFKIVPAAGALDQALVTVDSRFDCAADTLDFRGRKLRLPRDTHVYGDLSVAQIVAKSSNRGAAHLGVLLGEKRLYDYSVAFGFGEPTGYALGGEVKGMLHRVRDWDGLTISRLPMGHAVGVTPLQIHNAMAAVANDGVLMRPQVVRRIVDRDGGTAIAFEPFARNRAVSVETARTMSRLLVGVVQKGGTAPMAEIPGFEVAGKTGTTQKIVDGRYSTRHHVGSFIGFFPASNPRVVVSVIIDDARLRGTAYGSTVAAPSFKAIAEQLIQYLSISPTEPARAGINVAGLHSTANSPRDRLR
jgi:cell division protein FtsI (penicillin-binding protein 3)/stage V sporulation protein D (sporulation-specific penicillin-binding protein)